MDDQILEVMETARDLWLRGWAEGTAGNLSLRLKPENLKDIGEFSPSPWLPLPVGLPDMSGECFIVTGTTRFMRTMERLPEQEAGIIQMGAEGNEYRILWGFESGDGPTSELLTHLRAHNTRKGVSNGVDRAVIHAHPPHAVALSYALDLDTIRLSRLLWEMHAECIVVFPEGVAFIPWLLPGSEAVAESTAGELERRRAVLWASHGILGTGEDLNGAFGLVETVEKAAEIYIKARQAGGIRNRLTTDQLAALAERFSLRPDAAILRAETDFS